MGFLLPGGVLVGLMGVTAGSPPCDPAAFIHVSAGEARVSVGARVQVLEDPGRQLNLADVQRFDRDHRFVAGRAPLGPDLASSSRFWERLCVDFEGELPQRYFLYLSFPSLDRLCVHWPKEPAPAYETTCSGLFYAQSSRPVAHEGFVFPVPPHADLTRPVYLEEQSRTPMSLDIELVRADVFVADDHSRQFLAGLFNGILLLAAIYSFVFFSGMRDRAALLYALHLTALALAILGFEGMGYEFVWPWLGPASAHVPTILLGTSFVCGVAYGREFLKTWVRAPLCDRGLWAAGIVAAAVIPTSLISIDAAERMGALAGICFVIAVGVAGMVLARQGDRPARYLLLGLSPPLLVGLVVIGLRVLGLSWIPRPLGIAATKAGLVIGAATMSLALNQRLRELRQQRDRARAEAAAQQQIALHRAYFDELTELPNRSRFMVDGTQLLGETLNTAGVLAVLVLNVVRFREVNHALGQAAGDLVLVTIGRRLRAALGRSALVARLGGDEFAAALVIDPDPVRGKASVRRQAESLLEVISAPQVIEGRSLRLSATIGLSIAPADAQTLAELLRDAEMAIDWARSTGEEAPIFYSAKDRPEPEGELALRTELWKAVDTDELEVFYQPQHDLGTGLLAGAEALVRWRHPRLGLLPPGGFIAIAEQSELISRIGEKVLRTACRDERRWLALGFAPPKVSVNTSARDFQREGFQDQVAAVLEEEGIEPRRIELELTESRLVANLAATGRCMARLRRHGVRVCLDDFGTGYSSLSQIRDLPINGLKVDKSFVAALGESAEADAILGTLVRLSDDLRLELTAEGVETERQRDLLKAFGCRFAQGYLYARPMPHAEMTEYLGRQGADTKPREPLRVA
jgi:diguanylate cyclase (GGDEF)-like protein